jgi:adenine/guanine phosphoribosyltransferase-like PRPP-binding protein
MSAYTNVMVHPASLGRAGEWVASKAKELKATLMFGTGTSGMSVGSVASVLSGLMYLHLRKEGESSHGSPGEVIFPCSSAVGFASDLRDADQRIIIVDDFISGGNTVQRLIDKVRAEGRGDGKWEIVAIVLYSDHKDPNDRYVDVSFRDTGIPIIRTHIFPEKKK